MPTSTQNKTRSRRHAERAAILLDDSTIKSSGLFDTASFCVPTLTFLSGDALGKELPILQQQITLGRGEDCDVLIMDPSVSRKHVQLSCRKLIARNDRRDLKVVLRDLGSTNGTMVNYRKVRHAVLKAGDKIILGRIILKFEYKDLADQKFFDEIYRLATTDSLTGMMNRAAIMRVLQDELIKRHRYRRKLSIVLMDLDEFKNLNDTYGHLMGDRALQAVSSVVLGNLRRQDRGGRIGGEEFLLVLPETGLRGAIALADRIRQEIHESVRHQLGLERDLTASFGVAACPAHRDGSDDLVDHADSALYRAKSLGKNRVERWKRVKHPGQDGS
jgi:two-component system cell cycle response regulator